MSIETAPCGACGKTGPATPLFTCRDIVFKVTDEVFTVGRCTGCGHVYLSGRPPAAEIGRFYPDGYDAHRKTEKPSERRKSKRHRFITRKPPFRILDVGCGSGYDLLRFKDSGCSLFGVEHNPSAADQARANGATVFTGGIEDADFPDASFDVVTMNFSLEHLYEPRKAMTNVKRMLAPGGIVYLLFPIADGLTFRWFGPDWHHLDPPRHLQFFNHASFERLCRDTGLEVVHAGARSGTRGIRRSLGLIGERSRTAKILSRISGLGPFHWALRVIVRCFVDPFGLGEIGEYLVRRAGDETPRS